MQAQQAEITRIGRDHGLTVVGYTPLEVRRRLCQDEWATKGDVANVLVGRFPA